MKKGISYLLILGMVFLYHALSLKILSLLVPLLMYLFPLLSGQQVNLRLKVNDLISGIGTSMIFLLPACLFFYEGKALFYPTAGLLLYQFLGVALPEEFYFRGFLQEGLGNNLRAVVFVSILFAMMHLPRLIFYSDLLSILTFLPSLIMGYLYLKTRNILASTVFHFLANTAFYLLGYKL